MQICVSKLTTIGSDNGLLPGRCQAIIRTNAGILLIGQLRTNFIEILIEIHASLFKKMHFKMLSAKVRPFYLGLNMLIVIAIVIQFIFSGLTGCLAHLLHFFFTEIALLVNPQMYKSIMAHEK